MGKASSAKRKRAAVRSAKRSRTNTWWYGLTAIVVIAGVSLIVYAKQTAPAPVGPFLADASNPTKKDTHWHAALGVYDCDHWMGDTPGSGIWQWKYATPSGTPARASDTSQYAGLHSHDDGVIHMEPASSEEAGRNATVGRYFDFGGWKISATSFDFLGTKRTNGDKCGTVPGTLQWALAKWDGTNNTQKYTLEKGNPGDYKLYNGDILLIGFMPQGKSITGLGNPPSVKNLENALNVETKPGSTMPTIPANTTPSTSVAPPTTRAGTTATSKP